PFCIRHSCIDRKAAQRIQLPETTNTADGSVPYSRGPPERRCRSRYFAVNLVHPREFISSVHPGPGGTSHPHAMLQSGYITGYTGGICHEYRAAETSAEALPEASWPARDGPIRGPGARRRSRVDPVARQAARWQWP